jgi:hypothetical protein
LGLRESTIYPSGFKQTFFPLTLDVASADDRSLEKDYFPECLELPNAVQWFLNNHISPAGLGVLHQRYLYYLDKRGLVNFTGLVKQRELTEEFLEFYSPRFLRMLKSGVSLYNQDK